MRQPSYTFLLNKDCLATFLCASLLLPSFLRALLPSSSTLALGSSALSSRELVVVLEDYVLPNAHALLRTGNVRSHKAQSQVRPKDAFIFRVAGRVALQGGLSCLLRDRHHGQTRSHRGRGRSSKDRGQERIRKWDEADVLLLACVLLGGVQQVK